jgi:Homeodomain-like domain-containing protein
VPKLDDATLQVLAGSVRELIEAGELSAEEGLAHIIFPTPAMLEAAREVAAERGPFFYSEATRQRGLELIAQGLSQREAAAELGVPRTSVQQWVARDRRERGIEEPGIAAMPKGFRMHWEKSALSP